MQRTENIKSLALSKLKIVSDSNKIDFSLIEHFSLSLVGVYKIRFFRILDFPNFI